VIDESEFGVFVNDDFHAAIKQRGEPKSKFAFHGVDLVGKLAGMEPAGG